FIAGDGAAEAAGVHGLLVFDADDFGAKIGQHTSGGGPGDDPGEVAHADAGEGHIGHGRGVYRKGSKAVRRRSGDTVRCADGVASFATGRRKESPNRPSLKRTS